MYDSEKTMKIKILGSGQDDGIPHTGCYCDVCNKARTHIDYQRLGPSLALFHKKRSYCYLIDASPDLKRQLDSIHEEMNETKRKGKIPVSGILLTHAHLGHCAGLWHLGMEAVNEENLPVLCTPKMKQFLCNNYPFNLLVQRRNIKIEEINPNEEFELAGATIVPIEVPHRNEIGDTVGYIINSARSVFYLPDTDRWTNDIVDKINNCDVALIDGTFYSKNEISRSTEVPHPPMKETVSLLEDADTEIYFTHINHTNPVNEKGSEERYIESKGFKIATDHTVIGI